MHHIMETDTKQYINKMCTSDIWEFTQTLIDLPKNIFCLTTCYIYMLYNIGLF